MEISYFLIIRCIDYNIAEAHTMETYPRHGLEAGNQMMQQSQCHTSLLVWKEREC